jgi:phospholipid/cholesterol/gamma-HCH transport system substrate-binding protein
MSENATEVVVGGAVLAAAVAFVVYAGEVTGFGRGGDTYQLSASFTSAEGVTVGSDVRLAGVKVGTVTALRLNPDTYYADVAFALDRRILLPEDSAALISQEGLLGGAFVELQPGGAMDNLPPGGEIVDTQGAVSLLTLLLRAFMGGEETASEEG